MNPRELIALARALVNGIIGGSATAAASQTELRRAVSCTYYAMFHTLAASNANTLVGELPSGQRDWAWRQAYRALDHRPARNKLSRAGLGGRFPQDVLAFGDQFAIAQRMRHSADYDPYAELQASRVSELINNSEAYILAFNQVHTGIRRQLAVHIITSARGE